MSIKIGSRVEIICAAVVERKLSNGFSYYGEYQGLTDPVGSGFIFHGIKLEDGGVQHIRQDWIIAIHQCPDHTLPG